MGSQLPAAPKSVDVRIVRAHHTRHHPSDLAMIQMIRYSNEGENIGEECFKTESGEGENTDGKMIRKNAKTEEEFEVCCSTGAEGENKDGICEGCKFISYYSPCYPSLIKKLLVISTRSSKQNIIAGKMLFAFVLFLCFCGSEAYNIGTSWRNGNAFAALKTDGSVVAWGDNEYGGSYGLANIQTIYSTSGAFAALKTDGSVEAWGELCNLCDVSAPSGLTNVQTIYSTSDTFAALKTDGSVVAWGTAPSSGLTNVQTIYSNVQAFAALKTDGSVVAWGDASYGGNVSSSGLTNVTSIYSNFYAFAALKTDSSVIAWGHFIFGGNAPSGLTSVKTIYSTSGAFAALKIDGSVVAWGGASYGGNAPSGLTNVQTVYSTSSAFAALKIDGSVVAWGYSTSGGNAPSGLTSVKTIYSTDQAFAALKTDGSVVAWGNHGGTAPSGLTNVQTIYSTNGAFAALKTDGAVVAWGYSTSGGNAPSGLTNVQTIYSTDQAFATLKTDGSVVAWGKQDKGGFAPSGLTNVKVIYGATKYRSISTEPHLYAACEYETRPVNINGDYCAFYPTGEPSGLPSGQPSGEPSGEPSGQPTTQPTQPTGQPTRRPSGQPSGQPSTQPSGQPSGQPSAKPTGQPTGSPTFEGSTIVEYGVPFKYVAQNNLYYDSIANVTGLLPKNDDENTYLSVYLWRIAWSGNEYLGMKIKFLNNTWTKERRYPPPYRQTCGEDASDDNYDNCWSNIDVTKFLHPEHGGTLYLQLSSNFQGKTQPNCQKEETSVYTKFEVSHSRMPTLSPTSPPAPPDLLSFNLNPQVWGFLAVIVALLTLGLGIFLTLLRRGSKAVEIAIPQTGFIMLFIGGHTVTTIVVLVDILESKYEGWGLVIAMMRLLHAVVAIFILATIYRLYQGSCTKT